MVLFENGVTDRAVQRSARLCELYIDTIWQTVGKVELNCEANALFTSRFIVPEDEACPKERFEKCAAGAEMQRPPRY